MKHPIALFTQQLKQLCRCAFAVLTKLKIVQFRLVRFTSKPGIEKGHNCHDDEKGWIRRDGEQPSPPFIQREGSKT